MQWNRLFRAQSTECARAQRSRSGGRQRAGMLAATIVASVLFCGAPVRTLADLPPGDQVYLENGTNVTSLVFYVGAQAYLYPNNPIPITINVVEHHVYDQYGNLIGYITDSSGS